MCNFFLMAQLKKHTCLLQSHNINIARFIYIFSITITKDFYVSVSAEYWAIISLRSCRLISLKYFWLCNLVLNTEIPMMSNRQDKFCHPKYFSIKICLISCLTILKSSIHLSLVFIFSQIFYYACFGGLSAYYYARGP